MKWFSLFIMAVLGPLSINVQAAQEYKVSDGDVVRIKVSAHDLTRIAIKGDGRLTKVRAEREDIEVKEDKKNGQIFIRPKPSVKKSFSFFLSDDSGATYTMLATKVDVPSQSVFLVPDVTFKKSTGVTRFKTHPYTRSIKELMKSMATGGDPVGYNIRSVGEYVPLWKETDIYLMKMYVSKDISGEIYKLNNISSSAMQLHESEFLNFGDNVLAVAIEQLALAQGQSTLFYIVRQSR